MNNKGFSLVELLAVIVILAVIAIAGGLNVGGIAKEQKKQMYCDKISRLIQNATNAADDNRKNYRISLTGTNKQNASGKYVNKSCFASFSVSELIASGVIEADTTINGVKCLEDPYLGSCINGDVRFYKKNNRVYAYYVDTEEHAKGTAANISGLSFNINDYSNNNYYEKICGDAPKYSEVPDRPIKDLVLSGGSYVCN